MLITNRFPREWNFNYIGFFSGIGQDAFKQKSSRG